MPAILGIAVMMGSWMAQRRHERFNKHYYDTMVLQDVPEIPPGHLKPPILERDLIRRTLLWCSSAAIAAVGLFVYFAMTPIGQRACDPVRFSQPTGLQLCDGPAQWSDALIAYEVWVMILGGGIWAIIMLARARRFRAPKEKPAKTKKRTGKLGLLRRAQAQ